MKSEHLKGPLEGLLFASGDEGITVKQLVNVLNVNEVTIKELLDELKNDYKNNNRGITMMQSHEVYHLTTKPEHSSYFKKMLETPQPSRMSQAALETLAIIAYNQPITRTEIENIRGVNSDRPVQTLLARMLIEEAGRRDSIGKPVIFTTTKDFLTYFGLISLEELPPLPEDFTQEEIEKEADLFTDELNS